MARRHPRSACRSTAETGMMRPAVSRMPFATATPSVGPRAKASPFSASASAARSPAAWATRLARANSSPAASLWPRSSSDQARPRRP